MSPFVTVGVLTVLWLIVVVPMVVRRNDELARDRSVSQFGRAMRALGRRSDTRRDPVRSLADPPPAEVFVPGADPRARRFVPAVQEAAMQPDDRHELTAARAAMMARRRRSLAVLGIGSLITTVFALVAGGLVWLLSVLFLLGLAGYLFFLRKQALVDRQRRSGRSDAGRSRATRTVRGESRDDYDDYDEYPADDSGLGDTVVRIDDDDIHLQTMDTIDFTGLWPAEQEPAPAAERRAS